MGGKACCGMCSLAHTDCMHALDRVLPFLAYAGSLTPLCATHSCTSTVQARHQRENIHTGRDRLDIRCSWLLLAPAAAGARFLPHPAIGCCCWLLQVVACLVLSPASWLGGRPPSALLPAGWLAGHKRRLLLLLLLLPSPPQYAAASSRRCLQGGGAGAFGPWDTAPAPGAMGFVSLAVARQAR